MHAAHTHACSGGAVGWGGWWRESDLFFAARVRARSRWPRHSALPPSLPPLLCSWGPTRVMHCSSSLLQLSDFDFRAGTSSLDVCVRDMCACVRGVSVRVCVCMCVCV